MISTIGSESTRAAARRPTDLVGLRLAGVFTAVCIAGLASLASGCASNADSATAAVAIGDESSWITADAGSTNGTDKGGSDEADGGGGGPVGFADAGTAESDVPFPGGPDSGGDSDDNASIGLKPGGAQDIALFRYLISLGTVPGADQMTIEGWLNEHDTKLPAASEQRPIDLHALAGLFTADSTAAPEIAIQIGFNSALTADELLVKKVAMTVVVDRSGSMHGERIERLRATLRDLAGAMPEATVFTLVAFGAEAEVRWGPDTLDATTLPSVHAAIDALVAGGGTNLAAGLALGLAQVADAPSGYDSRHLLLFSDGAPTVGNTDPQAIVAMAASAAAQGTTISTVAIGADADAALLLEMAGNGGAAITVGDLATLPARVASEILTLLPPVVDSLWLRFELADGFHSPEFYGFELTAVTGGYAVRSLDDDGNGSTGADAQGAIDATAGGVDGQPTPEDTGGGTKTGLASLHAAHSNGMLMLRLSAPAGMTVGQWAQLTLAKVHYGYRLAATGATHEHEVPVQVPGLVQIADGGLAYFASPIVRRSFALLQAGLGMRKAVGRFHGGHPAEAAQIIDATQAFVGSQSDALADADDPDNALQEAWQLLGDLRALMP